MATNTLSLFCLISGELASRAFPISTSTTATVGELKNLIKTEKSPEFDNVAADKLSLWRVSIPVATNKHKPIILNEFESAAELDPTDEISELFKKKTLPKKSIHIIIERPKAVSTSTPESDTRIAKPIEEIADLRGGKSIVVLNVVLRPNRSECFSWTTDTETTSIKNLERAIYGEYPNREGGHPVLAIIHARGTFQHEGGGTEYPSDDTRFRNIIKQYGKTNTRTLTVALETPTKKYTDFTLNKVNSLFDISNMESPWIRDLPPFNDISTEALDSNLHKESLRRLLDEIDSRIRAIPSDTFSNEATCSAYVCSFLTQAVLIFNGELALAPERPLRGRHGHGKVDYAIEALAKDGSRHVLGVTKVKNEDYRKGLAQNLVQLESSLIMRKRKRGNDDNGDEEQEEDSSVPMRAYGIVTDATYWFFVECSIDQSQESSSDDHPKFRVSRLDDIVNYNKSTWRAEAESVLGQILWLMRKMHSEIPGRELQNKKQRFTTSVQSAGKMQRV